MKSTAKVVSNLSSVLRLQWIMHIWKEVPKYLKRSAYNSFCDYNQSCSLMLVWQKRNRPRPASWSDQTMWWRLIRSQAWIGRSTVAVRAWVMHTVSLVWFPASLAWQLYITYEGILLPLIPGHSQETDLVGKTQGPHLVKLQVMTVSCYCQQHWEPYRVHHVQESASDGTILAFGHSTQFTFTELSSSFRKCFGV